MLEGFVYNLKHQKVCGKAPENFVKQKEMVLPAN